MLGYCVLGSIRVCIVIWVLDPVVYGWSNEPVVVCTSLQMGRWKSSAIHLNSLAAAGRYLIVVDNQ